MIDNKSYLTMNKTQAVINKQSEINSQVLEECVNFGTTVGLQVFLLL